MIIDKHAKQAEVKQQSVPPVQKDTQEEVFSDNGLIEAYKAIRKILEGIKEDPKADPNDESAPPLFKTVKLDNGQLSRIKNNLINREYGIGFPAAFIHFIDVYYNQGMSRVSEGKGVARIRYVLNKLNNSDDEVELEGLRVYQRIVAAIEENKASFPALVSRFQLQYWDQPLSHDDGLQEYWISYQIWFKDVSTMRYKDYVDTYVVCPPFTQHSDQNETANPEHLPDDKEPKFEDCAGFKDFKQN